VAQINKANKLTFNINRNRRLDRTEPECRRCHWPHVESNKQ